MPTSLHLLRFNVIIETISDNLM